MNKSNSDVINEIYLNDIGNIPEPDWDSFGDKEIKYVDTTGFPWNNDDLKEYYYNKSYHPANHINSTTPDNSNETFYYNLKKYKNHWKYALGSPLDYLRVKGENHIALDSKDDRVVTMYQSYSQDTTKQIDSKRLKETIQNLWKYVSRSIPQSKYREEIPWVEGAIGIFERFSEKFKALDSYENTIENWKSHSFEWSRAIEEIQELCDSILKKEFGIGVTIRNWDGVTKIGGPSSIKKKYNEKSFYVNKDGEEALNLNDVKYTREKDKIYSAEDIVLGMETSYHIGKFLLTILNEYLVLELTSNFFGVSGYLIHSSYVLQNGRIIQKDEASGKNVRVFGYDNVSYEHLNTRIVNRDTYTFFITHDWRNLISPFLMTLFEPLVHPVVPICAKGYIKEELLERGVMDKPNASTKLKYSVGIKRFHTGFMTYAAVGEYASESVEVVDKKGNKYKEKKPIIPEKIKGSLAYRKSLKYSIASSTSIVDLDIPNPDDDLRDIPYQEKVSYRNDLISRVKNEIFESVGNGTLEYVSQIRETNNGVHIWSSVLKEWIDVNNIEEANDNLDVDLRCKLACLFIDFQLMTFESVKELDKYKDYCGKSLGRHVNIGGSSYKIITDFAMFKLGQIANEKNFQWKYEFYKSFNSTKDFWSKFNKERIESIEIKDSGKDLSYEFKKAKLKQDITKEIESHKAYNQSTIQVFRNELESKIEDDSIVYSFKF